MKNLEVIDKKRMLIIGGAISGLSIGVYPFVLIKFIEGKYFDLFFFISYTLLMLIITIYLIIEIIKYKKRG